MFRLSIAFTLLSMILVPLTKAQDKPPQAPAEVPLDQRELNTALMESTFKIEGPAGPGKTKPSARPASCFEISCSKNR